MKGHFYLNQEVLKLLTIEITVGTHSPPISVAIQLKTISLYTFASKIKKYHLLEQPVMIQQLSLILHTLISST